MEELSCFLYSVKFLYPWLEAMTEQEADAYLAMLCASMLLPLLNDSEDG